MSKSLLRLALLCAPLVLAGCGEGWEMVKVTDYGTYGGDRTAGTGVAYVRAKMLPKKEFVVEPVMEEIKADGEAEVKPMEEPAPVLEAEEIFTAAQQKGVAPEAAAKVKEEGEEKAEDATAVKEDGKTVSMDEVKKEADAAKTAVKEEVKKPAVKAKKTLTPMPDIEDKGENLDEEHSSFRGEVGIKMVAEDYIAQAPKSFIAPKVEVIKMTSYETISDVQMMKTAGIDRSNLEGVEVYENEVVHPQKHIIVPKKDMGSYLSVGAEELNEIYSQPF